jgi:hypothetical protein
MQCGAKTRGGGTCKSPAMENGRCRMHGGKSKKGIESGTYKHGLYSKYAGESLKDVLSELDGISSDELIQPEQEIRLMSALIMKCKGIENGADDLKDLDTISKILERLIHAKQRSQAIMIEQQRLVPASDIERFLDYVETLLVDRIGEQDGYAIIEEFKNFKLSQN